MFKSGVAFVEKFFWMMVWVIALLIVAFWMLALAENKGQGNIIGRFATWVNDHARPQAS